VGDVVNLRLARKAKRRADDARDADTARAKSGRTKAEREVARIEEARATRLLDGAKREPDQT
jgi:hypothetical protein